MEVSTWEELKKSSGIYNVLLSGEKVVADIETKDLNGHTGRASGQHHFYDDGDG